ncbi:MarR family winged helix-turn-helix transcriptional regulator [Nocardioides bruguierae]|uniref:MarR family transcriptional regulator n=1 Tax=Nocardioides bruguierae TaxID=2945102 RepID=A0A9X2D4H2_9ACTN|nr:MarR family transcriptional regulator [Nocardioides bruguierae]MCM0619110.1 MarR family transcriptional regulator [Nocardioides bruguierae]
MTSDTAPPPAGGGDGWAALPGGDPDAVRHADVADHVAAIARELLGRHFPHDAVPLTANEVAVLRFVHRHPGATSGQAAAATGLQRSNLSTTLRALERQGLIERTHGEDARTVRLHATDRAEASTRAVRRQWSGLVAQALAEADVAEEDLATTLRVLAALEDGLRP